MNTRLFRDKKLILFFKNSHRLKLLSFIFISVITIQNIVAQTTVNAPKQYASTWRTIQVVRDLLNTQSRDQPIKFEDIKGSPYEHDAFKLGNVYLNDSLLGQFMLRFNNYSNELEVLSDKKDESGNLNYDAFLKLEGLHFSIEDSEYNLMSILDSDNNIKKRYLKTLVNTGKYQLYQHNYTKLTPARKAMTFNEIDRAARFTTYTEYYSNEGKNLKPLPTKKKSFLKFFGNHTSTIKEFLRKEKIKLDEPEGLTKVIEFINTL